MSLSLQHVHLTYPDGDARLVALDDIALDVAPGRLVAITGPSGSGKSSLLAVAGLLKAPDSGRVVIGGQDTTELCRAERTRSRRERPGFVFQQSNLLPSLTAVEQLLMVTHVAGTTDRTTESQARNLLGDLGLGTHADRRAHGLSGGQRQRVGIARALMNAPNVLLVDEPTSALDHERGHDVVELLVRVVHERDVAAVMVTHDHTHLPLVDEVLQMDDGRFRCAAEDAAQVVRC